MNQVLSGYVKIFDTS